MWYRPNSAIDEDLPYEIEITNKDGTIRRSSESYWRKKSLLGSLPIAIVTVQRSLKSIPHGRKNNPWFLFQIDIRTVSFLQDTLVEIVPMMNIQVPTANFRDGHVVTAQFRCLHVPDDVLAVVILVSYFHHSRGDTVNSLPVDVQSVPRGTKTMWLCGLKGDLPNCRVTAPPPFTRRSNQPSSLVKVKPSRGVLVLTRTPIRPVPRCVTTRPRTTADRLSGNNNVNDPMAVSVLK